ncbi:MAG: PAS domain S-box protein [Candidatus Hydrogenedentes bacterium]|nr:PAS domain S-box protein [Candidatus Hydrogenedentota bacterium]
MTNTGLSLPARLTVGGFAPWLIAIGAVRVAAILVIASGTLLIGDYGYGEKLYLCFFYAFGIISALGYLLALRHTRLVIAPLTWAQVLVDFGVVAATVSFTGGLGSLYTFLFVIIVLEGGILLGLIQGYLFATLAAIVMGTLAIMRSEPAAVLPAAGQWYNQDEYTLWYGYLIQVLAYYLTASISGYWNQQLHRLQRFQREILDNMNNGFLISDLEGIITVVNRAAERILDLSEDEAIGRPVQEVLRVASGEECPVVTALRSERDFTRYEYTGLLPDGKTMLLGLSTSRIYDWRNRMTGIIASFSDLTELEQMRQELKRQDRLSIVGELAAGLAHEIRNPVAAIRGAVDEMATNLDKPAVASKLASIAVRESDQLNTIVSDFLDFARKPSMRRDVFDVRGLIDEVTDLMLRNYTQCEHLVIKKDYPKGVCPVSGDRSQIRQVFLNLAKNAIEAMDGKGTLKILVILGPSSVEVRFDDEGPGIPPDQVARIFEPFYTTKDTGVGMGLAICLRIVSAHDGTIRAASRESGGASFSVRLPRALTKEQG